MNKSRGRGRPSGETGARDAILDVARTRFLADGYDHVTLRSVAAEAGVDVALISYHFGSKKGLFGAALALGANPAVLVAQVFSGPPETAPERLIRTVLAVWDDPDTGPRLRLLAQEAVRETDVSRLFREVMDREMLPVIAAHIGGSDATRRAVVAMTMIGGIIMGRYLMRIEPIASMPVDELVARTAPLMRTALTPRRVRR